MLNETFFEFSNTVIFLQKFSCDESSTFQLDDCGLRKDRIPRQWTDWKILTECRSSCLIGGSGVRLVTRQCLQSQCEGLQRSVQLCHTTSASTYNCKEVLSTQHYAAKICQKYKVNDILSKAERGRPKADRAKRL